MALEITEEERSLLLELLDSAENAAIQGMDHAETRSFKKVVRERLQLLAAVKEKIRSADSRVA